MKRKIVYSLIILVLAAGLQAEQIMTSDETEALIRQLTDNPRSCWIPQGIIRARHMEYYEFDSSMKETTETVYRNGNRYRLEMYLEDGMSVSDISAQQSPKQFRQDFRLNRNRIFVWDGQKYTQYYQSADYAVIVTNPEQVSHELCGPATAGIIPWGHGDYSFLVLLSQHPTCRITYQDGRELILLEYISDTISLQTQISLLLDPVRDYAVLSYSIENEQALLRQTYEDYLQTADRWVPSKILIERFDKRSGTPQLISYEDWQFETVDAAIPSDEMFSLTFANGTMVELQAADGLKTFLYNACDQVDISAILEDKIALLQTPDPDTVNCATAAIQHVAKQFSKTIQQPELAGLVSKESRKTALSDMKQTLEQSGLTCMAVETDLETLGKLPACTKVLLYMALSDHYVILDHIEQDAVWLIDLTDRKFFSRNNIDEFLTEWENGVALLVSNEPITPPLNANFRYLETDEMAHIYGGGSFGKYSCKDLIQQSTVINCPEAIGGVICCGAYYDFAERYGCIEDEEGGTCKGEKFISYTYSPCVNNPQIQNSCLVRDDYITRYIRACK